MTDPPAASPSVTEPETRREPDVTRREYDERDEQIWNESPPRDGIDQYARETDPFYTAVRGERRESVRKIVVPPPDPLKDAAALLERWLYSGSMTRPDIDALQQSTEEWIREQAD